MPAEIIGLDLYVQHIHVPYRFFPSLSYILIVKNKSIPQRLSKSRGLARSLHSRPNCTPYSLSHACSATSPGFSGRSPHERREASRVREREGTNERGASPSTLRQGQRKCTLLLHAALLHTVGEARLLV